MLIAGKGCLAGVGIHLQRFVEGFTDVPGALLGFFRKEIDLQFSLFRLLVGGQLQTGVLLVISGGGGNADGRVVRGQLEAFAGAGDFLQNLIADADVYAVSLFAG